MNDHQHVSHGCFTITQFVGPGRGERQSPDQFQRSDRIKLFHVASRGSGPLAFNSKGRCGLLGAGPFAEKLGWWERSAGLRILIQRKSRGASCTRRPAGEIDNAMDVALGIAINNLDRTRQAVRLKRCVGRPAIARAWKGAMRHRIKLDHTSQGWNGKRSGS